MKYQDFLRQLDHCPFCATHEEEVIISNDQAILTYAKAPYTVDHVIVVPRRHVEQIEDISEQELLEINRLVLKGVKMLKQLGHDTVSFLTREGENSGRTIKHVHYHLVPDLQIEVAGSPNLEREMLSDEEVETLRKRLTEVA